MSTTKPLTPKQQRFIAEYLIDLNATQAAVRAGYSAKTAKVIGCQLLTKLNPLIEAKRAAAIEKADINAAKVLRRLDEAVDAKISDIYTDKGELKPVHDWPDVWQRMCVGMEPIFKRSTDGENDSWDQAGFKVKFERGNKAIELLGRHVDINAFAQPTEKHEHVHLHVTVEDRLTQARLVAANTRKA